jgi:hypothetical protein
VRRRLGALVLAVAAAVAIAGCYGNPAPTITAAPPDCAPVKILLVGDSLMVQSADAIVEKFHDAGYPVDALSIAHGGSDSLEYGIFANPDLGFTDPRDELRQTLATFQPDVVLVNWGVNPPWSLWFRPEVVDLAPWAIQATMAETVDIVDASGAQLYWTTIPPVDGDNAGWAYYANEWVKALDVPLVDWRAAVSSKEGIYQQFLKYPEDDSVHPVRTEDGLHFTPNGVDRVAQWTVSALAPVACAAASDAETGSGAD